MGLLCSYAIKLVCIPLLLHIKSLDVFTWNQSEWLLCEQAISKITSYSNIKRFTARAALT